VGRPVYNHQYTYENQQQYDGYYDADDSHHRILELHWLKHLQGKHLLNLVDSITARIGEIKHTYFLRCSCYSVLLIPHPVAKPIGFI